MHRIHTWIGALWGVLIGVFVAFWGSAFSASLAWLYFIGDNPTEAQHRLGITVFAVGAILGIASGLGIAAFCIRWGVKHDRAKKPVTLLSGLLFAAVILIDVVSLGGFATSRWQAQQKQVAESKSVDQFCEMYEKRDRVLNITPAQTADGWGMAVTIAGNVHGEYRVLLTLKDVSGNAFLSKEESVTVDGMRENIQSAVSLKDVKDAYWKVVLNQTKAKVKVKVEETFQVSVNIKPLLTESEQASLPSSIPPCAFESLGKGLDPLSLEDEKSAEIPVSFTVGG